MSSVGSAVKVGALLGVDLTSVWEEVAEAKTRRPARRNDSADAFGMRSDRYPELSATSQALLVSAYQRYQEMRVAQSAGVAFSTNPQVVKQTLREGEICAEYLLGSVFRLVRTKVWDRARARFGDQWASEVFPELLADAHATVLHAAVTFDPDKGPTFASWACEILDHELAGHMGKHGQSGTMPVNWGKLSRIAHHIIRDYETKYDRKPSNAELRIALEEKAREWADEHLPADQQHLTGAERDKAVTEKMRKQGMLKALTEVPEIVAAMEPAKALDSTLEEGSVSYGESVAGNDYASDSVDAQTQASEYQQVLSVGTGNLDDKEKVMVLTYLGLGSEDGGTYKKVAQQFGVPDLQLKHLVRDTQARLRAPHAQYAHLAENLASQFDAPGVSLKEMRVRKGVK